MANTIKGGTAVKKNILTIVVVLLLCIGFAIPSFANEGDVLSDGERLYDGADLFSAEEEKDIEDKLNKVTDKYDVEFIIATVETVGDYSATEYTEQYYDDGKYGIGDKRSGVLLFITMDDGKGGRAYRIHTRGFAEVAISESEQIDIGDDVATYLSDGDYADAAEVFIEKCEYQINGEINGFPFKFGRNLIISLVIGLVSALIVTGMWKGQLKSVRQQSGAANYTKQGSFNVAFANDFFLYRKVTREKKPDNKSSSSSSGGGRTTGGSF